MSIMFTLVSRMASLSEGLCLRCHVTKIFFLFLDRLRQLVHLPLEISLDSKCFLLHSQAGTKNGRVQPETLRVVGVGRMGNKREYSGSIESRFLRSFLLVTFCFRRLTLTSLAAPISCVTGINAKVAPGVQTSTISTLGIYPSISSSSTPAFFLLLENASECPISAISGKFATTSPTNLKIVPFSQFVDRKSNFGRPLPPP
jgi:hypothetical protein